MTNWAFQIVFKNRWTPFIDIVYWFVFVLTIAIQSDIVGAPGKNIQSYFRTTITKKCCAPGAIDCAPGLKYLDTPVFCFYACKIGC